MMKAMVNILNVMKQIKMVINQGRGRKKLQIFTSYRKRAWKMSVDAYTFWWAEFVRETILAQIYHKIYYRNCMVEHRKKK